MTDLEKHVNQPGRAKLVKQVRAKINELKSKLPNSLAVYSIKIILAISLLFLVTLFVSYTLKPFINKN